MKGKKHWNYSWRLREVKLGWRGFILEDLRDKPTRGTCGDGIFILLVGKPNGTDDLFFGRSDVPAKNKNEIKKIKTYTVTWRSSGCIKINWWQFLKR